MTCRILDVIIALLTLLILSPVMLIIALAVRLESPGPAIFSQERVGRFQRRFTLHKFRTMAADASHDRHREFVQELYAGQRPEATGGNPRFKLAGDPRITRIGRFLRRSSLDELPQLWNVIRGEMSLVGPRPPIHYEVEAYPADHWFTRFDVQPGLDRPLAGQRTLRTDARRDDRAGHRVRAAAVAEVEPADPAPNATRGTGKPRGLLSFRKPPRREDGRAKEPSPPAAALSCQAARESRRVRPPQGRAARVKSPR